MDGFRKKGQKVMLDAAAANGVGTAVRVTGARNVLFQVSSDTLGACTLKFQGSLTGPTSLPAEDEAPDFSATREPTNHWDYLGTWDLENGTGVRGDTGYTLAGNDEDNCFNVMANTEGMDWVSVEVTNYSAGNIYVTAFPFIPE